METAKPAAGLPGDGGGNREIVITDWRPRIQNTLRGFVSVSLPTSMLISNLTIHEKGEARWAGLPARDWVNQAGVKQYAKLIEFKDRRTADRFRDRVLAALDRYLVDGGVA